MNELHKEWHANGELDSTIYKNLKSMKLKKNYSQKMKIKSLSSSNHERAIDKALTLSESL